MRSYEERMAEARKKVLSDENEYGLSDGDEANGAEAAHIATSENSSAYDVASETSSELQQPSIDTQKLDRQIKSVMMVSYQYYYTMCLFTLLLLPLKFLFLSNHNLK